MREHDREQVAAQARDAVDVARRLAQPLRHLLQHAVADLLAEGVVDRLEALEVDQRQRERASPARRAPSIACVRRSWNSVRLGSPVSGS